MSTTSAHQHPFYSSACQYCQTPSQSPQRCSQCKLNAYCSREHQSLDWPSHRAFCKAATRTKLQLNRQVNTIEQLNAFKSLLKHGIEAVLQRPLTFNENTICFNLNVCAVCFKDSKLKHCGECLVVGYCSEEHAQEHAGRHAKHCHALKLCREIDLNLTESEVRFDVQLSDNKQPRDIDDLLLKMQLNANERDCCLYTHLLSPCGTILYALDAIKLDGIDNLTIHIVGAASDEYKYDWELFERVIKQFHKLSSVSFIFIGPELICNEDLPPLEFYKSCYHEIIDELPRPNLVVCFNAGLHEYENTINDTWSPSIPCLLRYENVPLLLTAYLADEIECDVKRLQPYVKKVLIASRQNPFGSKKPFRNWDSFDNPIFYSNSYVFMCS